MTSKGTHSLIVPNSTSDILVFAMNLRPLTWRMARRYLRHTHGSTALVHGICRSYIFMIGGLVLSGWLGNHGVWWYTTEPTAIHNAVVSFVLQTTVDSGTVAALFMLLRLEHKERHRKTLPPLTKQHIYIQ